MRPPLAPKQLEFIANSTAKWNFAHGSVRSGKTIGTLFRFMQAVNDCPDSDIYMIGHTSKTIYRNVIKLLFEDPTLMVFRPFCSWSGGNKNELTFRDKKIHALGAKDEGAVGLIQGLTASLVYCDEMTLYPQSVIEMINSRLSRSHSMGFAAMNPSHPSHIIKQWIDLGLAGDKNYYSLHFNVEDNPFLDADYINMLRNSSSGIFYKRNYLGQWCLASGSIFDFFDRSVYVKPRPPKNAEYWIAGCDVGVTNNFACVLIGVSTGKYDQAGVCRWVEDEYVWDSVKQERQKTMSEYADAVQKFIEPYNVKQLYIDPSAAAFKVELRKRGISCVDANNDVVEGINFTTSEMKKGNLFVCQNCPNTIREIESYVWDPKKAEKGEDAPLKKDDHCLDAMRYAVYTHKVASYDYQEHNKRQQDYWNNRFGPRGDFR
jgi:PBSX family phage terminase large subunit